MGQEGVHTGAVSLFIIRVLRAKKEEKKSLEGRERYANDVRFVGTKKGGMKRRLESTAALCTRLTYILLQLFLPPFRCFDDQDFCSPSFYSRYHAIGRVKKHSSPSWWVSNGEEKNVLARHSSRPIYRSFHSHHV